MAKHFQNFLVTGGTYSSLTSTRILDSTEVLSRGSTKWREVGRLPLELTGLKAVNILNTVYSFGKKDIRNDNYVDLYIGLQAGRAEMDIQLGQY